MHLARLRTCALNPAWTAGFRGRSVKFVRAPFAGRARGFRIRAETPSTARCCVSPSTRPPHRRFGPTVGTNTASPFLDCFRRRRAIEAATSPRGRHPGCSPGLTRITDPGAGAPCRDGRGRSSPRRLRRRGQPRQRAKCISCTTYANSANSAKSVILRAVAGSTLANEAVSGVDSATTRGMTGGGGGGARCPSRQVRRHLDP